MTQRYTTVNPFTELPLQTYSYLSDLQLEQLIAQGNDSFFKWRNKSVSQRSAFCVKLATCLERHKLELANSITKEMGKPLYQSEAEIDKCIWVSRYYATAAIEGLAPYAISDVNAEVHFHPLGGVLGIMPWNYPIWQVIRFAVPTLVAGNNVYIKHAPNVFGTSVLIEAIFQEALGECSGVYQNLIITHEQVSSLIQDKRIQGVSLTGSDIAGRVVAAEAGKAIKKSILELGGNDAYLVLEDADLSLAATLCVKSRISNAGQVCIASKRWVLQEKIADEFIDTVIGLMRGETLGDPMVQGVTVGPLARKDLYDRLSFQVTDSLNKGAKCLYQSETPDGKGFFYPLTLLSEVSKGMPAFEEELFGPVGIIYRATSLGDMITIANDTPYGLGAAVFSQDSQTLQQCVERLEAGIIGLNQAVHSDPRVPFGGIKKSGYGRELGVEGLRTFTNQKVILSKN